MRSITILTYHSLDTSQSVVSVSPQIFSQQMASLDNAGFRAICLNDALDHHAANGTWPEHSVVVTFDDGYENLHQYALPILSQYCFGATIFMVTEHVGKQNDWATFPKGMTRRAILSWDQAKALREIGIEFGAHTRTHPDLRCLPQSQVNEEIVGARQDLEEQLQCKVQTFAYPFGSVNPVIATIAAANFRASCTTRLSRANDNSYHHLPRVDMYYFQHCTDLRHLVMGDCDGYLTVRRWARRVKQLAIRQYSIVPRGG